MVTEEILDRQSDLRRHELFDPVEQHFLQLGRTEAELPFRGISGTDDFVVFTEVDLTGKYFRTEAMQASEAGIELWSNCNSAGLTWDFGNIPFQPAPWQWKKKWDALKDAHRKWNLSGLRENHEYGWYPSFIAELEKEYLVEEDVDFDALVRAIAVRDYGEANAEAAMRAWRLWSRAADDYVPTDEEIAQGLSKIPNIEG